jgi:hypothetical protein
MAACPLAVVLVVVPPSRPVVVQALDQRLTLALQVAEAITPAELDRTDRVF